MDNTAELNVDLIQQEFLNPDDDIASEEESLSTLNKLKEQNREKMVIIDGYINRLWSKRVWASTFLNISLVCTTLFTGTIFLASVIFTAMMHVWDKYLDYSVHKMYQKKEYARYG